MDPGRLPHRVLIDTGVFIRALGQRPEDVQSADCKDFVEAMAHHNREVLVAAPSLAEMIRGLPVPTPPTTTGMLVVAFDDLAAVILGTRFPAKTLKHMAAGTAVPLTYLKYDAMIAACAIRHKAQYLVSLDARLAAQVPASLKIAVPGAFREKQLPLLPQAAAATTKAPKKKP